MNHPSTGTASHSALPSVDANRNLTDAGVPEPYRPPYLQRFNLSNKTQLGIGGTTDGGSPGEGTS